MSQRIRTNSSEEIGNFVEGCYCVIPTRLSTSENNVDKLKCLHGLMCLRTLRTYPQKERDIVDAISTLRTGEPHFWYCIPNQHILNFQSNIYLFKIIWWSLLRKYVARLLPVRCTQEWRIYEIMWYRQKSLEHSIAFVGEGRVRGGRCLMFDYQKNLGRCHYCSTIL